MRRLLAGFGNALVGSGDLGVYVALINVGYTGADEGGEGFVAQQAVGLYIQAQAHQPMLKQPCAMEPMTLPSLTSSS